MAMQRNLKKRNEILNCTYQLISETEYRKVFLRDIAEKTGISKSLLQYYFYKKSDMIDNILNDMLSLSFQYIDQKVPADESIHLKLSVYTQLFWDTLSEHERWNNFVVNIISERELMEIWINIVYNWLLTLKDDSRNIFTDNKLKVALSFAMAGGLELYLKRDEMYIEVTSICEYITTAFMKVLNNPEEDIRETLNKARLISERLDKEEFIVYCNNQIGWFL